MFSPLLLSVPFTKLVLAHSLTCELTRGHGCSEPSARAKSAGSRPGGLRSKVKKTRFGFSRLLPAGIEVACCHQPTTALRRACFCNCCLRRATFHASAATEIGNIYCSAIVVAASVIMKSRHEVVRGPRSSSPLGPSHRLILFVHVLADSLVMLRMSHCVLVRGRRPRRVVIVALLLRRTRRARCD